MLLPDITILTSAQISPRFDIPRISYLCRVACPYSISSSSSFIASFLISACAFFWLIQLLNSFINWIFAWRIYFVFWFPGHFGSLLCTEEYTHKDKKICFDWICHECPDLPVFYVNGFWVRGKKFLPEPMSESEEHILVHEKDWISLHWFERLRVKTECYIFINFLVLYSIEFITNAQIRPHLCKPDLDEGKDFFS